VSIWRHCLYGVLLSVAGPSWAFADSSPLVLRSLEFSPDSIETVRGGAEVTLRFSATDDLSGMAYFEAAFSDPSGTIQRSASLRLAPQRSVNGSVRIVFPRLESGGEWTLSHVFLSDAAGNTLPMNTEALIRAGFHTRLKVRSAQDITAPKLTDLKLIPAADASAGAPSVQLQYSATDDFSGVRYVEFTFSSPSGVAQERASAKFEPAESVSGTASVHFPPFGESGRWSLTGVFLSDAAGNTLILDESGIAGLGFQTGVEVKSRTDRNPPKLIAFRFSPTSVDTTQRAASIAIEFELEDDLSGLTFFETVFTNPNSGLSYRASAEFPQPQLREKGMVTITFPKGSEPADWAVTMIAAGDRAGNTLVLEGDLLDSMRVFRLLRIQ
jgi:hypothetical protein